MNWKKIGNLLGIVVLACSMVGCSSEGKLTRKEMKEVKKTQIKALEDMYPGRQFEIYDMKQYGDMYGYFQKYYYRCLNDGVTFDHDSFSDDGPQQYLWAKWDNDGKQLVEKSREEIFHREGYSTFHISMFGGEKDDIEIYNPDLMALDAFEKFNSKYTGSRLYIECMLYTDEREQIDWEKESKAIYQMYEHYILPYKNLTDFEYCFSVDYLNPGAGYYEEGKWLYTRIPKEFIQKEIIISEKLLINSPEEIFNILNSFEAETEE